MVQGLDHPGDDSSVSIVRLHRLASDVLGQVHSCDGECQHTRI
jgi:hypothetical protein